MGVNSDSPVLVRRNGWETGFKRTTTFKVSASLSSSCPTILTNGYPSSKSAAALSETAEALHRKARRPALALLARGLARMGVPAREDAMDAIEATCELPRTWCRRCGM